MSIRVTSTAFSEGARIPKNYSGEGKDVSPPLSWSGVPRQAQELALICDDPDAPGAEPWVHWVIYGIAADATGLPEGIPAQKHVEAHDGLTQGKNSWPTIGYRGPMPPPKHGTHHYHFRLYALDRKLEAAPGLDKAGLLAAMKGHVLATGELVGTYER